MLLESFGWRNCDLPSPLFCTLYLNVDAQLSVKQSGQQERNIYELLIVNILTNLSKSGIRIPVRFIGMHAVKLYILDQIMRQCMRLKYKTAYSNMFKETLKERVW